MNADGLRYCARSSPCISDASQNIQSRWCPSLYTTGTRTDALNSWQSKFREWPKLERVLVSYFKSNRKEMKPPDALSSCPYTR